MANYNSIDEIPMANYNSTRTVMATIIIPGTVMANYNSTSNRNGKL
jgi:hypothetical protein